MYSRSDLWRGGVCKPAGRAQAPKALIAPVQQGGGDGGGGGGGGDDSLLGPRVAKALRESLEALRAAEGAAAALPALASAQAALATFARGLLLAAPPPPSDAAALALAGRVAAAAFAPIEPLLDAYAGLEAEVLGAALGGADLTARGGVEGVARRAAAFVPNLAEALEARP